jgi:H+/Cl- antiporter ClcA
MGGALADQFTAIFKLDKSDRKTVIILGISGICLSFRNALSRSAIRFRSFILAKSVTKAWFYPLVAFIAYYTVEIWK